MKQLLFEGSEKKLELVLSPVREPLRNQPEAFWKKLCTRAGAQVVSRFSNSFCDSYILSESSLFVWDHRLVMLTCGETSLVKALLQLSHSLKISDTELLFYQRKNEFFPYKQNSSFMDDLKKINKKIKGKAYLFGAPDEHHFYLFHSEGCYRPGQPDRTIEILMYDLDDHIKNLFFTASSVEQIRDNLNLSKIFEGAQGDDHFFEPMGYSLNSLVGKSQYYTIHITPQEPGFYVSFETNIMDRSVNEIAKTVLSLFKPLSFDIIVFSAGLTKEEESFKAPKDSSFSRSSYFSRNLECGYKVDFSSFFTGFDSPRPAFELNYKKEAN